jgi:hypothetical protein
MVLRLGSARGRPEEARVTAYQVSVAMTVILLFPMLYFAIASLTFFLARLQDPVVTRMLRSLFSASFLAVSILAAIAALAFTGAGRMSFALGLLLVAGCAAIMRRWFLRQLDRLIAARDAGEPIALKGLRRVHVAGIAYNAVQLGGMVASIPAVFPTA